MVATDTRYDNVEVKIADWADRVQRDILRDIRQRVFVEEQGVPVEEEWDDKDSNAVHFMAMDGKRPVGCARLFADGYFGRMAVLAEHRDQHWGSRLIKTMGDYYQREMGGRMLKASVQAQAFNFYLRNGFTPEVEFFWDAAIPHLTMTKILGRDHSVSHDFKLGEDSQVYTYQNKAAIEGLFQIGCQNRPRAIVLLINDLQHPMWSSSSSLDSIKRFIRSSTKRHIQILIDSEYAGINDHPLIQLASRMSSRIELKVHSGLKMNGALFEPYGYLLASGSDVKACFNDRSTTSRYKEQFTELWTSARPTREARRIHL